MLEYEGVSTHFPPMRYDLHRTDSQRNTQSNFLLAADAKLPQDECRVQGDY